MELLSLAGGLARFLVDGLQTRDLSFIVKFPALGKRELAFQPAVFQVQPERNKSKPLFRRLSNQLSNLAAVQEELPRSQRIVVGRIPVRIGTDVTVEQPNLSAFDNAVGVLEVRSAVSGGFDLRPCQDNPGLESFYDFIVVKSLTIDSNLIVHRVTPGVAPGSVPGPLGCGGAGAVAGAPPGKPPPPNGPAAAGVAFGLFAPGTGGSCPGVGALGLDEVLAGLGFG